MGRLALGVIHRQRLCGSAQALPVRQLACQLRALRVGLQVLGPIPVAAGFVTEVDRLARGRLLIGTAEVFQEDAPGHTIHQQVMATQQQALAAVRQPCQQHTQQRSALKIQTALGLFAERLQRFDTGDAALPEQAFCLLLVTIERRPGARGVLFESQAQSIVVVDQGL
ncbi:hypothetical protein D9M68_861490 [compost metagenome]